MTIKASGMSMRPWTGGNGLEQGYGPMPYSLGWSVRESEVRLVLDPIAPRQKYEKVWTWSGATDKMEWRPWIHTLLVNTPGVVVVSALPQESKSKSTTTEVPLVRVTSATEHALQTMRLWRNEDNTTLKVSSTSFLLGEYVLVEVFLPRICALQTLECDARADVVVEDRVLLSGAPDLAATLKLTTYGAIYVMSRSELHANALHTTVVGSGTIQIFAPSMVYHDSFEASVTSTGSVRVFADHLYARNLKLTNSGTGEIQIAVSNVQGVQAMEATLYGAGSTRVVGDAFQASQCTINETGSALMVFANREELELGRLECMITGASKFRVGCNQSICNKEEITIRGAGIVDAQDLLAVDSDINVMGAGRVKFQAYHQVNSKTMGAAGVVLVGNAPQWLQGDVKIVPRVTAPLVHELMSSSKPPRPIPTRATAFQHAIEADIFITIGVELARFGRALWRLCSKHLDACLAPSEPFNEPKPSKRSAFP